MAANYEVTRITRTVDLSPGAPTGYMYEVSFVTSPHGATGSVLIPINAYTAAEAAAMIAPIADELERSFNL